MTTNTQPIPIGLGTKLGVLAAAISSLVGAIFAIADGDHSPETITALVVAGGLIYGVVKGRMDQATALAGPPPVTVVNNTAAGEATPFSGQVGETVFGETSSPTMEPAWSAADYDDEPETDDTEHAAAAKVPVHTGPITDEGDAGEEGER